MKMCPICQNQYPEDCVFCLKDGSVLTKSVDDVECVGAVTQSLNFCGNCAEPMSTEFAFCKRCGTPQNKYGGDTKTLTQAESVSNVDPFQKSSQLKWLEENKTLAIIATIVASTIVVGLMLFAFSRDNNQGGVAGVTNRSAIDLDANVANSIANAANRVMSTSYNYPTNSSRPLVDSRSSLNENSEHPNTGSTRPSGGIWFVVLGSYPKSQPEKSDQRLVYVQGLGYNATVVDTDKYPGFKGGLYSVVIGPYSRSDAQSQLGLVKTSISDAYIKSGWK
jgi:hypothetical protein